MKFPATRTPLAGRIQSYPAAHKRGFALVVTLSLMILLTVLAVGLLSLSAVELRATAQGQAMAVARANARLSLMMALGDLQRTMGPDGRISVPAEQSLPAAASETSPHRQWTGVYQAWDADQGLDERPEPKFVQWLVSPASLDEVRERTFADSQKTTEIPMVGAGTLGAQTPLAAGAVTSPSLSIVAARQKGKLAWWIADESMKAHVVAGAPRAAFAAGSEAEPLFGANSGISANAAGLATLGEIPLDDPQRPGYLSTAQFRLKNPDAGSLFHDVTAFSRGLPVDVTRRRFKFDFSCLSLLDRSQVGNLPLYKADGAVNRFAIGSNGITNGEEFRMFDGDPAAMLKRFGDASQQSGIHLEELWTHANVYRNLTWNAGVPSMRMMNGAESGSSGEFRRRALSDPWFSYTKPVFASLQFVLSFVSKPAAAGKYNMRLQMDVLVKVWNPNNVRVEIPPGGSFAVQLLSIPFKVQWSITNPAGVAVTRPQSNLGNNTYALTNGKWASSNPKTTYGVDEFRWLRGNIGGLAEKGNSIGYTLEPGECKVFGYDKENSASTSADPNVDLSPGWGPGRQALIIGNFGANNLNADDVVEFVVTPDDGPVRDDVNRTYCNKFIGHRASSGQGNGGLTLGSSALPVTVDFAKPDPTRFPEARSSQRLKVSEYSSPKPFMIFGTYMNVEQSSAGTLDAFASAPRLMTNPAITSRPFRGFEPDQLAKAQEIWRCDPLPMAYDSALIDINSQDQGRFGGGHNAQTGVTRCATRQLDAAPPLSLMSLSHAIANGFTDRFGQVDARVSVGLGSLQSDGLAGNYKFEPGDIAFSTVSYAAPQVERAIGNSFASPFIKADEVTGSGFYYGPEDRTLPFFDHSYLANAALFDSWFCSGLHDGGKFPSGAPYQDSRNAATVLSEFFEQAASDPEKRLLNPRVLPASAATAAQDRLITGTALRPEAIARLGAHVFLDGAFNVNSTRKDAWRAVLSSARDSAKLLNGKPVSNTGKTPFGSSGIVAAEAASPAANPTDVNQWSGFRALDDSQIDKLAEQIVKQVKARGPFLSLADFINRRPGDSGDARLLGVAQAAIEAAGLNDALKGGNRSAAASDFANLAAPEAANAGGGLSRSTGIPGYLMQSDLLSAVANELTPRGDTFRIRGYGSATDANGRVIAEAWCEAIVQRMPDYLDPADPAETEHAGLANKVNQTFGRRFQIITFQWLPREAV